MRKFLPGIFGDQCIIFRDQGSIDPPWGPSDLAVPPGKPPSRLGRRDVLFLYSYGMLLNFKYNVSDVKHTGKLSVVAYLHLQRTNLSRSHLQYGIYKKSHLKL